MSLDVAQTLLSAASTLISTRAFELADYYLHIGKKL